MARNHTLAGQRRQPLPTTIDEMKAVLADPARVRQLFEDDEFGPFVENAVDLRAFEMQQEMAAQIRNGDGGVRGRLDLSPSGASGARSATPNPLAFSAEALQAVQAGIDTRQSVRVPHDADAERLQQIRNAVVTTTTYGAPREWAAVELPGPRMLHVVAGVTRVPADAAEAEHAKLALPTATAASAEGATLTEYDSSTAGTVTLGRFGRFTDLSTESQIGTDARAIVAMHRLGIALDMDKVLIDKAETDAGSAVAFDADVPAAIRRAITRLVARTAAEDPTDIVILVHPDNSHLLEDVTPTGGRTIAESFQNFSGAKVYPSEAVDTAFMTVCNLRAGAIFFEAQDAVIETDDDIKLGVRTVATSLLGGYGTGAVGSYAIKQDVVTP